MSDRGSDEPDQAGHTEGWYDAEYEERRAELEAAMARIADSWDPDAPPEEGDKIQGTLVSMKNLLGTGGRRFGDPLALQWVDELLSKPHGLNERELRIIREWDFERTPNVPTSDDLKVIMRKWEEVNRDSQHQDPSGRTPGEREEGAGPGQHGLPVGDHADRHQGCTCPGREGAGDGHRPSCPGAGRGAGWGSTGGVAPGQGGSRAWPGGGSSPDRREQEGGPARHDGGERPEEHRRSARERWEAWVDRALKLEHDVHGRLHAGWLWKVTYSAGTVTMCSALIHIALRRWLPNVPWKWPWELPWDRLFFW